MPNYRRLHVPGGTYFLTLALHDRRQTLLTDHIDHLRAAWAHTAKRHPFETIAAVILPDHLHMVARLPNGDDTYANRIRQIKSGFTRRLPDTLKGTGRKGERRIWQSRYWEHLIRDDTDFDNHIAYIHMNPVKHGLVTHPDHWPHSTWHKWKETDGKSLSAPSSDWSPTSASPDP